VPNAEKAFHRPFLAGTKGCTVSDRALRPAAGRALFSALLATRAEATKRVGFMVLHTANSGAYDENAGLSRAVATSAKISGPSTGRDSEVVRIGNGRNATHTCPGLPASRMLRFSAGAAGRVKGPTKRLSRLLAHLPA